VDREALVRRARRRQALDALTFERDRAALLTDQLEEMVASVDGAGLDAAVYAQLDPGELQLVRAALRDDDRDESADDEDDDAVDPQEDEEEILRLQGELDLSARVQAALERYLEVL
jgi:hypothetical protein